MVSELKEVGLVNFLRGYMFPPDTTGPRGTLRKLLLSLGVIPVGPMAAWSKDTDLCEASISSRTRNSRSPALALCQGYIITSVRRLVKLGVRA